jgi:hypothetical protein
MVSLHVWSYCSGSDQSISVQSSIFGLGVCQGNDGNGYTVLQFFAECLKYVVDVSLNLLSFQADETTHVLF